MNEASPTTLTEAPATVTATPKDILRFVVIMIGFQGSVGLLALVAIAIFKIDTPMALLLPLVTITGQIIGTLQGMLINTRQPVQQNGEPPNASSNASEVTPERK